MIRFVRSAQVLPGKGPEVMEQGPKIAAYLAETHGMTIRFGHEVGGQVGRVYWVSEHESMAAMEETMMALDQDEAFDALLDAGIDNYMAGHTQDRILRFF